MKRDIVVLLTRTPYGRVHVPEGLRAARGVAGGFDRHSVAVIFTQDGVYAARRGVDRAALNMEGHLADLPSDAELIADRASMDERAITSEEIAEDIDVRSGERVAQHIRAADHTLDF